MSLFTAAITRPFSTRRARPKDTRHLTAKEGDAAHEEHEKQMNFLGPPRDWIERFGRHFIVTEHTHLEGNKEREILPWLRISAELDPQKIETYIVAAYWLRDLGKVKEAERFLRQGMLNNPDSYEILFELGRLYYENDHDTARARKIWDLALRKWAEAGGGEQEARPLQARSNRRQPLAPGGDRRGISRAPSSSSNSPRRPPPIRRRCSSKLTTSSRSSLPCRPLEEVRS